MVERLERGRGTVSKVAGRGLLALAVAVASAVCSAQPSTGNAVADQAWRDLKAADERVNRGQALEAIEPIRRALQVLVQQLGPTHWQSVSALHSLSMAYDHSGQQVLQVATLRELSARATEANGPLHEMTLGYDFILASKLMTLGQLDEAARRFEGLVQRHAQAKPGDTRALLTMRSYVASVRLELGLLREATEEQARIAEASAKAFGPNDKGTIALRNNLATSYLNQGRIEEGLELWRQTVEGAVQAHGAEDEDTLYWTGQYAARLASYGGDSKHVRALREADARGRRVRAEQARAQPDQPGWRVNYVVFSYGNALHALGEHAQALAVYLEHREALRRKGDATGVAEFSFNVAIELDRLGRTQEAVAELAPAVQWLRGQGAGADWRMRMWSTNLGRMLVSLGRHAEALALSRERLALAPESLQAGSAGSLGELVVAELSHRTGDDVAALRHAEDFERIAEQARWRSGLGVSERQSAYRSHATGYSQLSILMGRAAARTRDEALRRRLLEAGFRFGERAKGRTLAESMAQRRAAEGAGLAPQDVARLASLRAAAAAFEQQLAGAEGRPGGPAAQEAMRQAREGLDRTGRELRDLQEAIAARNPKYAALRAVRQAEAGDAGRVLAADQVFVSYVAGARGEWGAWLLAPEGRPAFVDLGADKALGEAIRELRRPYASGLPGATAAMNATLQRLAERLVQPLLALPAAATARQWVISPEGELALLPFDLLPAGPGGRLAAQKTLALVQGWTVLAMLKEREAQYAALARPKALFTMGNAVYEPANATAPATRGMARFDSGPLARLRSQTAPLALAAEQEALRALRWANLPATAREVQALATLLGREADAYTGEQASEAQMVRLNASGELARYRFLHLAAHGYLATNPSLSSLVLSQHARDAAHDGYITAAEWVTYRLQSDLMVLSACDTGVGAVLPGEGVMGLPYALFVAGNRNTLLTLWPVADEATSAFVTRFFEVLRAGQPQPQALAMVKREFMAHPKWSDPFFWAAFVLYGS